MNVKDVELVKVEGDMLKAMFARQHELELKYKEIESKNLGIPMPLRAEIDNPLHQYLIKDLMWRIVEELGEAANCLKNKPWKNTHMPTDEEHFMEEIADSMHFFIQLLLFLGLDAEEACLLYFKKSEVNKFRQRSNY